MDYHVHLGDSSTEVLPLDELRRRRQDGRMTGREFVWREGMPGWQTLDYILGIRPGATPPPPAKDTFLIVTLLCGAIIFIGGAIGYGVYVAKSIQKEVRETTQLRAPALESSPGLEAARRPIRQTPHTLREADVTKIKKAFRIRQYVDAYRDLGAHTQNWDADAKVFIRAWLDSTYATEDATNLPDVSKLGDKLAADSTCDDPIVLTAAASSCVELFEAVHRYERALKAFPSTPYKAYPRLFATVEQAVNYRRLGKTNRIAALDESALALFKAALRDGSLPPEEQSDLAQSFLNGWGASFFSRQGGRICSIVDEAGPAYAWLAGTLRGSYEINLAWQVRGGGWASGIPEKVWRSFQEHIEKAGRQLTQAWTAHPDWPQAPSQMITVAMAESDVDNMREWFDRATTAQIDYADAWHNMRWGLRPRWLGSLEALEAFGVAAVDCGRFDSEAPRQFFMSVKDVEEETDEPPGRHIYERTDIWPRMRQMYEGYIAEPTQAKNRATWRGCYATVAYFAQHYDVASNQLAAVDWKVAPSALEGWDADVSLLPLEVAARTSPQASAIGRAEAAFHQNHVTAALELYQKIPVEELDPRAQKFVQHRLASLPVEKQLEGGGWVPFLPAATNDLNWTLLRGSYQILPDGAIEVHSGPKGSLLRSRVRIGIDFEIKGEVELVHSTTGDFQAGLALGLPELEDYNWFGFRIKRNANEGPMAEYTWGWSPTGSKRPAMLKDGKNYFTLEVRHGHVLANVNGMVVVGVNHGPGTVRVSDDEFLVGLGAYNDMNETVVRYSNVRLRRLRTGDLSPRQQ